MKLARLITLLMLALCAQSQAHAWSGPGHAAVAAMAYRDLASNPTLRNNLVNLLRSHVKFNDWQNEFNLKKSDFPTELDLGMFLFIRAATWPDEIRGTHDPALQHFDHPNWHFVNYPLNPPSFSTGPSPSPTDDVIFGISESMKTLANTTAQPVERAASLSWLIHLVGDIHQPLHCVALITAGFPPPKGDEGGNKFLVFRNQAAKDTDETTKLHSFWDQQLGATSPPNPVKALNDARDIASANPRSSLNELTQGATVEAWSFESRNRAVNDAYKFQGVALKRRRVLPFGYAANAKRVAVRRIALAGYRLADEMQQAAF